MELQSFASRRLSAAAEGKGIAKHSPDRHSNGEAMIGDAMAKERIEMTGRGTARKGYA